MTGAGAPVLKLSTEDLSGGNGRAPLGYLESIMLFPDRADMRERSIEATTVEAAIEIAEVMNLDLPPDTVRVIRAAPRLHEFEREVKLRYCQGLMIGEIVIRVLCDPREKLMSAIAAAVTEFPYVAARIDRQKPRNMLTNVWPRFRSVAHLWGAHRVMKHWSIDRVFPCSLRELGTFLALVEGVRRAGQDRPLAGGNGPLIDPASAWQAAPELQLPPSPLQFG